MFFFGEVAGGTGEGIGDVCGDFATAEPLGAFPFLPGDVKDAAFAVAGGRAQLGVNLGGAGMGVDIVQVVGYAAVAIVVCGGARVSIHGDSMVSRGSVVATVVCGYLVGSGLVGFRLAGSVRHGSVLRACWVDR